MKYEYKTINFRTKGRKRIDQANEIIEEYAEDGFDLTLRQLYYQFVARNLIPNTPREYKNLGEIINNGRLAGLIDWESIVDRTREHQSKSHWTSPAHIISKAARGYAIDTRIDQDRYIEVWVEKDALAGVIERACGPLDVGYLSCRGYVSQSTMWRAAMRFENENKPVVLLHLGDHDPSGIDMGRDIQDRLDIFEADVTVKRIALNMEQVEQEQPPPNPAKTTDSRYAKYMDEYGNESWELDALDPRYLTALITKCVNKLTDQKRRKARIAIQKADQYRLFEISEEMGDDYER